MSKWNFPAVPTENELTRLNDVMPFGFLTFGTRLSQKTSPGYIRQRDRVRLRYLVSEYFTREAAHPRPQRSKVASGIIRHRHMGLIQIPAYRVLTRHSHSNTHLHWQVSFKVFDADGNNGLEINLLYHGARYEIKKLQRKYCVKPENDKLKRP